MAVFDFGVVDVAAENVERSHESFLIVVEHALARYGGGSVRLTLVARGEARHEGSVHVFLRYDFATVGVQRDDLVSGVAARGDAARDTGAAVVIFAVSGFSLSYLHAVFKFDARG